MTVMWYVVGTVRIRRKQAHPPKITRGIHTDILLNYETVKYFGGEEHEGARYREAMREYQVLELKVIRKHVLALFSSTSANKSCSILEPFESCPELHHRKWIAFMFHIEQPSLPK